MKLTQYCVNFWDLLIDYFKALSSGNIARVKIVAELLHRYTNSTYIVLILIKRFFISINVANFSGEMRRMPLHDSAL
jgi:hypothetical protein